MSAEDDNFLHLLAYGKDNKQKCNIIKFTNTFQLNILKRIASDIIHGHTSLKRYQIDYLKKSKKFIRKLAQGKVKKIELTRHYRTVCYIIKISLENYEAHSKTSTRTNRKVARNRRQVSSKRDNCEQSSSDESIEYSSTEDSESDKSGGIRESDNSENNSDVSMSASEE